MHGMIEYLRLFLVSARNDLAGILLIVLGACAGGSVGIASAFVWQSETVPLVVDDVSAPVPTVVIEAAVNGPVEGRVSGEARLVLGEDLVAQGSGSFKGFMKGSLPVTVDVLVPPGMKYVASKSGKKYYDVTSVMGNRLTPKNRVYFPDRVSAEAAGYLP